jgi:hypothetical protein
MISTSSRNCSRRRSHDQNGTVCLVTQSALPAEARRTARRPAGSTRHGFADDHLPHSENRRLLHQLQSRRTILYPARNTEIRSLWPLVLARGRILVSGHSARNPVIFNRSVRSGQNARRASEHTRTTRV